MFFILYLAIYRQIQSGCKGILYKRSLKHEKLKPALEIDQKTLGWKKVTKREKRESLLKKTFFFFWKRIREESQLFISGSWQMTFTYSSITHISWDIYTQNAETPFSHQIVPCKTKKYGSYGDCLTVAYPRTSCRSVNWLLTYYF